MSLGGFASLRVQLPSLPVVVYIKANMLKMSVNEAYSILLTHEARIESNKQNASK